MFLLYLSIDLRGNDIETQGAKGIALGIKELILVENVYLSIGW